MNESVTTAEQSSATPGQSPSVDRRAVLAAGAGVLAVGAVSACSAGNRTQQPTEQPGVAASGTVIASTGDVPVGSGKLVKVDRTVLLVGQPEAGEFVCHSGICTHQGCPLSRIDGADAICTCHGSVFAIADGSVLKGPASVSLPPVAVAVNGDQVTLA